MKIKVTNKKEHRSYVVETKREYKNCFHCVVINDEGYKGSFRIYKNWIGMDDEKFKVEVIG